MTATAPTAMATRRAMGCTFLISKKSQSLETPFRLSRGVKATYPLVARQRSTLPGSLALSRV
jgi:hypothetical protein